MIRQAISWLYNRLPGQYEAIIAVISGLIHGEPVLLVGPPGTGKTLLITSLARMLNARAYITQLHKYMTDIEILGPYNIRALQDGKLVRVWSSLVNADIIYLDEVFDAPSFLLRSLHSLLNERIVFDPFTGESHSINAIAILASANYIPTSPELQAVVDRFPIRPHIDYITTDGYEDAIIASNDTEEPPKGIISLNTLKELRSLIPSIIESEEFKREYIIIAQSLAGLRSFGVQISDRTLFAKLPRIIASIMNLINCPPEVMGCTMYASLLIIPWVTNTPNLPKDATKEVNNATSALIMSRNDFMNLVNMIKAFMKYEVKKLAGEAVDTAGIGNIVEELSEILRFRKWFTPIINAIEARLDYFSK